MQRPLRSLAQMRGWRAFVVALLAVFVLQTVSVAGHVHVPADAAKLSSADTGGASGESKRLPLKDDKRDCPMCQTASSSSVFFASSAPILRLPALHSTFVPRDETVVAVERFAAHWRSRAPPAV